MKSLKNVLAALAIAFAIGAAFVTNAKTGPPFSSWDGTTCTTNLQFAPCRPGLFVCTVNGVTYYNQSTCIPGLEFTNRQPPN